MKLLLLLFPLIAISAGRIQNSDVKSEAEILAAGGTKSQLINDSKIYLGGAINKTLDDAITDGDIGGGSSPVPLTKGQLITHDGTTYVAANACGDNQIIQWDSTQAYGFKCIDKPLELKYVQRLSIAGAGTWTRSSANVRRVEFYYCGGGGAGGGSTTTTATTVNAGNGGSAGILGKCVINNPSATVSYNIGAGGTGVTGAAGNSGAQTTITGCSAAVGGAGGTLGGGTIFIGTPFTTSVAGVGLPSNTLTVTNGVSRMSLASLEIARGASGTSVFQIVPEIYTDLATGGGAFSGPGTSAAGSSADVGSCSGGGGAASSVSRTTTQIGGAGGSGQIVSYEYE